MNALTESYVRSDEWREECITSAVIDHMGHMPDVQAAWDELVIEQSPAIHALAKLLVRIPNESTKAWQARAETAFTCFQQVLGDHFDAQVRKEYER
jgi:hypothetical protein